MRWGEHGRYQWLVAPSLPSLVESTVRFHHGLRLYITAHDSGPIRPTLEEQAEGWGVRGPAMVSPPLYEGLAIPSEQFDEWYLFAEPPPPDWEPEVFVNYTRFTLVPAAEILRGWDSTWDRRLLDGLCSLQE